MFDAVALPLLYAARLSPMFFLPSLIPFGKLPKLIKLSIVVSISILMSMSFDLELNVELNNAYNYLLALCQELIMGIALVFGLQITFAAILFAGKVIDLQIGFGAASVFDPMTRTQEALIGSLLNVLFIVAFFTLDIHHQLFAGLYTTFASFPVGTAFIFPDKALFLSYFSGQFILGLTVVMPVMLGIFLLEFVISLASRTMPQVNIYFVSLPIKIFLGLMILGMSMQYLAPVIVRNFESSISIWFSIFREVS